MKATKNRKNGTWVATQATKSGLILQAGAPTIDAALASLFEKVRQCS
mgnify:CR=1 FL=1